MTPATYALILIATHAFLPTVKALRAWRPPGNLGSHCQRG